MHLLRSGSLIVLALFGAPAQAAEPAVPSPVLKAAREVGLATQRWMKDHPRTAGLSPAHRPPPALTAAVERLRRMDGAREELRRALHQDLSYLTLSSAAYGLYLVAPSEVDAAVEVLVAQMNGMMFVDMMLAEELIMAIGPSAVPALTRHLSNSMVVQLLGAMGRDAAAAVAPLKGVLGTDNVEVAAALVAIGTPDAIAAARPVLLKGLRSGNHRYAPMALRAVGSLGRRGADFAPEVRRTAGSSNRDIRLAAAMALAEVGDIATAVQILIALARDKTFHDRYAAIQKLGKLGRQGRAAAPALFAILADRLDTGYGDRTTAAAALLKIEPRSPRVTAAIAAAAAREPELRKRLLKEGLIQG